MPALIVIGSGIAGHGAALLLALDGQHGHPARAGPRAAAPLALARRGTSGSAAA